MFFLSRFVVTNSNKKLIRRNHIMATNFVAINTLATQYARMSSMNISEIIWEIFQSEPYHMDKDTRESYQELRDSQFYYGRLVILLLYSLLSVTSSCISITLYRTVINLKLNFRGRNARFFISNSIFEVNPGVAKQMPKFNPKSLTWLLETKKHCFIFKMYSIVCVDKKSCFLWLNGLHYMKLHWDNM